MIITFDEFRLNESASSSVVKKGTRVKVVLEFLEGKPVSEVIAHYDSSYNDHFQTESFSFLFGGDMMMFAKWDGEKWVSN